MHGGENGFKNPFGGQNANWLFEEKIVRNTRKGEKWMHRPAVDHLNNLLNIWSTHFQFKPKTTAIRSIGQIEGANIKTWAWHLKTITNVTCNGSTDNSLPTHWVGKELQPSKTDCTRSLLGWSKISIRTLFEDLYWSIKLVLLYVLVSDTLHVILVSIFLSLYFSTTLIIWHNSKFVYWTKCIPPKSR